MRGSAGSRDEPLDAMELALALSRAPRRVEQVRAQPLPAGVGCVLRVATQEGATLGEVEAATGAERAELINAAYFFIESVLLHVSSDAWRTLGLSPNASAEQLKEHHRLLIRLMHPDRSRDNWTETYAQRINGAWNDLRTPEKRAASLVRASEAAPVPIVTPYVRARASDGGAALGPLRRWERLPQWVLGASAVIAIGVVATMAIESRHAPADDEEEAAVATRPDPTPAPALAPAPAPASPPLRTLEVESVAAAPAAEPIAAPPPPPPAPAPQPSPPPSKHEASVPAKPVPVAIAEPPLAPAPPPPPAPAPPPPAALTDSDIAAVLDRFRVAYAHGDLPTLLGLFTADAQNNRGGRDAIEKDYRDFFAANRVHTIAFEDVRIFVNGEEGTATARFSANVVKFNAREPVHVHGKVQFDLKRVGDTVGVARLLHEDG